MCLVNALVARVLMDYRNVFNQFHFTKLWSLVLAGAIVAVVIGTIRTQAFH